MTLEFGGHERVQFVIEITVNQGIGAFTRHGGPPWGQHHLMPFEVAVARAEAWTPRSRGGKDFSASDRRSRSLLAMASVSGEGLGSPCTSSLNSVISLALRFLSSQV